MQRYKGSVIWDRSGTFAFASSTRRCRRSLAAGLLLRRRVKSAQGSIKRVLGKGERQFGQWDLDSLIRQERLSHLPNPREGDEDSGRKKETRPNMFRPSS